MSEVIRKETTEESTSTGCPECGGEITKDEREYLCGDCGLVVDEDMIDHGPEWRSFGDDTSGQKQRTGDPRTEMLHDHGLSTQIGWRNKDGKGQQITGRRRERLSRLRTWDERARTKTGAERSLREGIGEIDRMGSALGVPKNIRSIASKMFRQAQDDGLLPGRSIEGVASACLYASARMQDAPRSLEEIEAVSRVEQDNIFGCYQKVRRNLELRIPNATPTDHLSQFTNLESVTHEIEKIARDMCRMIEGNHITSGKSPIVLAAGAVYAAGIVKGAHITQRELSEVADVSDVSIRNRYRELLDMYVEENPHLDRDGRNVGYVCVICEERYGRESALQNHYRNFSSQSVPIEAVNEAHGRNPEDPINELKEIHHKYEYTIDDVEAVFED